MIPFPTLWIVCFVTLLVFGLAAMWLWSMRRNTYDDRMAWNYGVGMIVSGLVASVALIVLLNEILNALFSSIAGLALVAGLLIALGRR